MAIPLIMTGIAIGVSQVALADEMPTRDITGKTAISGGLLQSGSFTTVEVWDHDKDGKDEMYLGGAGRSNPKTQGILAYEFNNATKTWAAYGSGLPTTGYYGALGLGDVNKDGYLDIAAPVPTMWYSVSTNAVYVYTSNSAGAFSLSHTFSPGKSTNEAEIGDIDADGNMDIAWTYYGGLTVQFGSGSATSWTESSPTAAGNELDGLALGDLNRDGKLDILSTPYSNSAIRLYVQGNSRSWTEVTFKTVNVGFGIKIADINNDGKNDVVYGTRSSGIKVWTGDGASSVGGTTFTWTDNSSGLPTGSGDWSQLELGDVNEDGKLDIIASSNGQNRTRIYLNNQPNSWTELFSASAEGLYIGGSAYGGNFGDWDGDGRLDCAGCSWGGGVDAWLINRPGTPPPPPINKAPVPKASNDITLLVGQTANLNGLASTDPEDAPTGDPAGTVLSYDWNITSVPAGSSITDASLTPSDKTASVSFVPDRVGTYNISLAVKDKKDKWSAPGAEDWVIVKALKPNELPVANAGQDKSAYRGAMVQMDGSASYDPDGTIGTWEWVCTSFNVAFSNPNSAKPTFIATHLGEHTITLKVRDNNLTWSPIDTVLVNIRDLGQDLPPIANAGTDVLVTLGDTVTLDGSGSFDPDGSIVTWEWTSLSHPSLVLSSPNSSSPSFVPAEVSTYVLSLRVRDTNGTWSAPDDVVVTVEAPYFNERPIADAGSDLDLKVGEKATLDGRSSSDPNGQVTEYNWTCTSHTLTLQEPRTARPYFVPSAVGNYIFELRVMDDEDAWSGPDTVMVKVTARPVTAFDATIGPFQYNDSTPLVGAIVTIAMASASRTATVGSSGTVSFTALLIGTYSVDVVLNGTKVISGKRFVLGSDGIVSYPDGPFPAVVKVVVPPVDDDDEPPADDDDDGSPMVGIIIGAALFILVMIVIGAIAALLVISRRKEAEDGPKVREKGMKECPKCKMPMQFKNDFNRYYCPSCKGYR
jgi:hypothetical protein